MTRLTLARKVAAITWSAADSTNTRTLPASRIGSWPPATWPFTRGTPRNEAPSNPLRSPTMLTSQGKIGGAMKTMVASIFLSLLSCCAFGQDKAAVSAAEAACGPSDVRFDVTTDKSKHPTPTPENGKALIYVVMQEAGGSSRIGADGKWLGALRGGGYFSASIDPGEHHLCAAAHSGGVYNCVSLHQLNAKASETYYFVVHLVEAVTAENFALSPVDPDEGRYLVAKAKFNASHPKQQYEGKYIPSR